MKKYLTLFFRLFFFSLKSNLSYRMSLVFKILHGPVYVIMLFLILQIAYYRTATLGGWNKDDALLLFAVYQMIYATCLIFFVDGIRHMLWQGIRLGEVDSWLMKPGSIQFFLTFSRPNTDLIALWIVDFIFFIYQFIRLVHVGWTELIAFWFLFILGHIIVYFSLSIYSTLGFFVTRAQQIVEVFDKSSDFSQYPLTIFPQSIQIFLSVILPIAFYSYVPTLFLREKGSPFWIIASVCFTIVLAILNHFSWKFALRHYSSASS